MTAETTVVLHYEGAGRLSPRRVPAAPPGAGEVEIAPVYTGICGTDLHILHGHMDARVRVPQVIGHETCGRITRVGPGVVGRQVGDVVTVLPVLPDGTCEACRRGHSHVCPNLVFLGIDAPGALQSRWVVPDELVVPVPDGLPLDVAALAEPAAVAHHDVARARVRAGQSVLVTGGGPVGVLIALVCRELGATVGLVEVSEARREHARSIGIEVCDPAVQSVADFVAERTDGVGVDVAFEVSGATEALTAAVQAVRVRGRLCVVAIHPQPQPVDLHRVFWRELEIVGARLYQRSDFVAALDFLVARAELVRTLVTRIVPLDGVGDAMAALSAGGANLKVLVDCQAPIADGADA